MSELDGLVARALGEAAVALGAVGEIGEEEIGEAVAAALTPLVGRRNVVIAPDAARVRGWPTPTVPVGVGVRGRLAGRHRAVVACAAWNPADGPARVVAAACAVASARRDGAGAAYLVAAAPAGAWERAEGASRLLFGADRATAPLVREAGVNRVAEGPAAVPGRLGTTPVAQAGIARPGGEWAARAVRVEPGGGELILG
ncbi:MAG: hypothetical protein AB7V42_07525 [Thermoleophilia bacterium]